MAAHDTRCSEATTMADLCSECRALYETIAYGPRLPCPQCFGSGQRGQGLCPLCAGYGRVLSTDWFEIRPGWCERCDRQGPLCDCYRAEIEREVP
jgi:hypothetical protein